jgi:hypothetical protein
MGVFIQEGKTRGDQPNSIRQKSELVPILKFRIPELK